MADLEMPANLLLRQMSTLDQGRLAPHLVRVEMRQREIVCEPGAPQDHVYFPTTSMLSSIVVLSDGRAIEAATIGREGMGGTAVLVGQRLSPYRVIQQVEGETLRIEADRFASVLEQSETLRLLITKYVFTLMEQCGQNSACNLTHAPPARLCRWLLQTSDRVGRHKYFITQEFLSEMIGASRQTVSSVASELKRSGLIEYNRGQVQLLDRRRLEHASCECYSHFNATYEKYMGVPIQKPS